MTTPNPQLAHLIQMANQIALNNSTHPEADAEAVQMVTTHLKKFWARSMKQAIIQYAEQDGAELHPIARQAVDKLALEYIQA